MVSANQLAESAMLGVGDDTDDTDDTDDADNSDDARDVGKTNEAYSASEGRVFATETMANLLEDQGDLAGAERVRASILDETCPVESESAAEVDASMPTLDLDSARDQRNTRDINRLERWLANIRRKVA